MLTACRHLVVVKQLRKHAVLFKLPQQLRCFLLRPRIPLLPLLLPTRWLQGRPACCCCRCRWCCCWCRCRRSLRPGTNHR